RGARDGGRAVLRREGGDRAGGDQDASRAELAGKDGERGETARGVVLVDVAHPARTSAVGAADREAGEGLQAGSGGRGPGRRGLSGEVGGGGSASRGRARRCGTRATRQAGRAVIGRRAGDHRSLPQAVTSAQSTDRSPCTTRG